MDDIFDPKNQVKATTLKFGKIGDWFKGTLTDDTRVAPNRLNPDKGDQRVYQFKAKGGSFHGINNKVVDAEPTECKEGEFWQVYAGKVMQSQLRNAKIGQIVGFRFDSEKAPTQPGHSPTKVINVYLGAMDPDYQGESAADGE